MKTSFYVLIVLISFVIFSCNEEDLCLKGSGNVQNYELSTDMFDKISLVGPINLRIQQGQTLSLNVDAEPEIFSELKYSVRDGLLEIGFDQNVSCFETNYGVWVNATLPDITQIQQSGVSEIISVGDLNITELELQISGTADVQLSGQVQQQIIESSGIIVAKNFGFLSTSSLIDISGTGDIELSCSDNLDIEVDGSAKISYKGSPSISQDVSGELELVDAN